MQFIIHEWCTHYFQVFPDKNIMDFVEKISRIQIDPQIKFNNARKVVLFDI